MNAELAFWLRPQATVTLTPAAVCFCVSRQGRVAVGDLGTR